jgi:hypothetical protein
MYHKKLLYIFISFLIFANCQNPFTVEKEIQKCKNEKKIKTNFYLGLILNIQPKKEISEFDFFAIYSILDGLDASENQCIRAARDGR